MASFYKDFLTIGAGKVAIIGFSLLQSVIIARWLGPELNGTIAALIVYPSLFISFGSLGIRQSTTYYLAKEIFTEVQIQKAIYQIWFLTSFISIITSFVLIRYFSNSGNDILLILLAVAPIPFVLFNTYNSGIFLGKNNIAEFNKIYWIPPFLVFFASVILIIVFHFSIYGAMSALVTGPLVMSTLLVYNNKYKKILSLHFEWRVIKSLLSLGVIYAVALLIINLNYKLDIILIDKLSTNYQTGIYSKGGALIQYLWQIPLLLSTIVFARSALAKDKRLFSLKVSQLLRISIVFISIGSVVLVLFASPIIKLLYGEAFKESATVLVLLAPGVVLLTIFKVLNMDMAGRGKPWISLKAMLPALIVNVIFNFLWIPKYGANGAALASTVSYIFAAVLFLFVYSGESGLTIKEILWYRKTDFDFVQDIIARIKTKNI